LNLKKKKKEEELRMHLGETSWEKRKQFQLIRVESVVVD